MKYSVYIYPGGAALGNPDVMIGLGYVEADNAPEAQARAAERWYDFSPKLKSGDFIVRRFDQDPYSMGKKAKEQNDD